MGTLQSFVSVIIKNIGKKVTMPTRDNLRENKIILMIKLDLLEANLKIN